MTMVYQVPKKQDAVVNVPFIWKQVMNYIFVVIKNIYACHIFQLISLLESIDSFQYFVIILAFSMWPNCLIVNIAAILNMADALVSLWCIYIYIYTYMSIFGHKIRWHKIKGLRPVLEGFIVTVHKGTCEQEVQSPGH